MSHAQTVIEDDDEGAASEQAAEPAVAHKPRRIVIHRKRKRIAASPPQHGPKYLPQGQLDEEFSLLRQLSQQVLHGDTQALDEIRVELDRRPHVWQMLGDLQREVEARLIEQIAGKNPLLLECHRKRCSVLRASLSTDRDSPAVSMAISRLVSCWVYCQLVELMAAKHPHDPGVTKRLLQAERRYAAAMRTFALAKQLEMQLTQHAEA